MTDTLPLLIGAVHISLLLILLSNLLYLRRGKHRASNAAFNETSPLLSILIPARNEANNLRRLIPSLLNQTYPSLEIIIYDDASEDETWNVISSFSDERLISARGHGPPSGWVGKVHALYQATRLATGERYCFLDADAALHDENAISRIVARFEGMPANSVLTGLPRYEGGGMMLVSMLPYTVLSCLPWWLVRPLKVSSLGALNGQCWLIDATVYKRYEPHQHVANEVLEDVLIGRYLKSMGITPVLIDVRNELSVFMYERFADAWRGFRKNAYLLLGGHILSFLIIFTRFFITHVWALMLIPWLLIPIYFNKVIADRTSGFSCWISLAAPLSYLLASTLAIDSAWHHLFGKVSWKGRTVHFQD